MSVGNGYRFHPGALMVFCLILSLCLGCSTPSQKAPSETALTEADLGAKIVYLETPANLEQFWTENELKKAFTHYWTIRFSGPWEACWDLEAPHFREMADRSRYRMYAEGYARNKLIEVVVKEVMPESDYLCVVNFALRYIMPNGDEKESWFLDQWVYVGDEWQHLLKDRLLFPEI